MHSKMSDREAQTLGVREGSQNKKHKTKGEDHIRFPIGPPHIYNCS